MTHIRFPLWLYALLAVGIVCYGVAEANTLLTLIALAVLACAWPVALSPKGKPLPRIAIALAVTAATAHLVLSLVQRPGELVTAVSRYLLWLQLIKLYDRIGLRDQAQLIAISVALVIGACLTSVRLLLGVLLVVYVPLLLWTASMFQIHAGRVRVAMARETLDPEGLAPARALRAARHWRPLAGMVAACALLIAPLTVVGFVLLPRSSASDEFSRMLFSTGAVTGFDDEVLLGSAGLLSESQAAVLDIEVTNERGQPAWPAGGRVYLRGAVLDEYDAGRWRTGARQRSRTFIRIVDSTDTFTIDDPMDGLPRLVQRVRFRDKQRPQLFTIHRPMALEISRLSRIQVSSADQTIAMDADGAVSYTVVSQPEAPVEGIFDGGRMSPLFVGTRVHDEALRILEEAGLSRDPEPRHTDTDADIARAIERHLWTRCLYTTEMVAPQRGEDPIDMFLFRTQRGHCEYFASAMAAMLRSLGVDARVVTGYVVTETEPGSSGAIVRESDAHAWVEAMIQPGVWRTYDPSPPLDIDALRAGPTGLALWWRDSRETMQNLWARAVVGYTRERQESLLGGLATPLRDRLGEVFEGAGVGMRVSPARAALHALVFGVLVFALVASGGFGLRAAWRRLRSWWRVRMALRRAARGDEELRERLSRAAFFLAASSRLRRAGMGRPDWLPPREHARRLSRIDDTLAEAMGRLVDLYYSARFGRIALTDEEVAAAAADLDLIGERIRHVRSARRKR